LHESFPPQTVLHIDLSVAAIRLWEGSWASDALSPDPEADSYINPDKVRQINHKGKYFALNTRHIVDPSPQRTPFLFQVGTSPAGSYFASTHAEAIFVSSHSPEVLRPTIARIRKLAAERGRDPQSIKFFGTFTHIVGETEEEAWAKYEELKATLKRKREQLHKEIADVSMAREILV
jgi:alkanesulfonate monooxygenase SsuD/methylene tetrahydromethanopterin reductase-like flavin-dependent oxidoreductase (luciferase family)